MTNQLVKDLREASRLIEHIVGDVNMLTKAADEIVHLQHQIVLLRAERDDARRGLDDARRERHDAQRWQSFKETDE